jgi:hypothetical protein
MGTVSSSQQPWRVRHLSAHDWLSEGAGVDDWSPKCPAVIVAGVSASLRKACTGRTLDGPRLVAASPSTPSAPHARQQ